MGEPTIQIIGRPPLQPDRRRSAVVTTRLRPAEYDAAFSRAKAAGFESVADYSRSLLTGQRSTSGQDDRS